MKKVSKNKKRVLPIGIRLWQCEKHGYNCPGKKTVDLEWYESLGVYREYELYKICPDYVPWVEPKRTFLEDVRDFFLGIIIMIIAGAVLYFLYIYLPSLSPGDGTWEPICPGGAATCY